MITLPNVKVNLGLNVLRRREDGYHDLSTLFVPYFEVHDVLEIVGKDEDSVLDEKFRQEYGSPSSTTAGGCVVQDISADGKLAVTIARKEGVDWNPAADLCAKAYRLLDKEFSLPPVKIYLEKLSPVGAGLGGGSSDAAFAIRMLNELFSLSLGEEAMAAYASGIGSDCAFFIYDRPMIGEGRGEILTPFSLYDIDYGADSSSSARYELKVVSPEGVAVSTAEAYKGIVPCIPSMSLKDVLAKPVEEWKGLLYNDFEKTVFALHPELEAIKQSLYDSGAVYASMSGSGSSLFAVYPKSV